jgi:hypothetical protein
MRGPPAVPLPEPAKEDCGREAVVGALVGELLETGRKGEFRG